MEPGSEIGQRFGARFGDGEQGVELGQFEQGAQILVEFRQTQLPTELPNLLGDGHQGTQSRRIDICRPRKIYEELPVALFIAMKSGKSVDYVVGLRARGMSWAAVFGKVGVPVDVLFVGIDRDPGPPYGKAWGHWKKKGHRVELADEVVTGLVQVQLGARWAGLSIYDMARARGKGKKVSTLVADRKGRPHKEAKIKNSGKGNKSDKPANAKGKEKSKGKKP